MTVETKTTKHAQNGTKNNNNNNKRLIITIICPRVSHVIFLFFAMMLMMVMFWHMIIISMISRMLFWALSTTKKAKTILFHSCSLPHFPFLDGDKQRYKQTNSIIIVNNSFRNCRTLAAAVISG